jgi:hypothetical protein
MVRWTARFVLLVMLVPVFGPMALATVAPQQGMHCMRRPLATAPAVAAEPAMHCHHDAAAAAPQAQSAANEVSFRSLDCCCPHCDCCRNSKISEWARPATSHPSLGSLLIEPAPGGFVAARVSAPLIDAGSARAPPRS